jgi:acetolactate synthase I/II/III large subunit
MTSTELSAVVADALAEAGGDILFGLPGGGNNLDTIGAAEAAGMRFVLAHGETTAAIMASVYADLSGRPAASVVTRGPGATSAVTGVANALLDRQQLLVVTDVVASTDRARIAHQRVDQRALYTPVVKWSATLGGEDAAGVVDHAITASQAYPRGPVHLDFDPTAASTPVPPLPLRPDPGPAAMARLTERVAAAGRPVVVLGVGARDLAPQVRSMLEGSPAPVLMTYRAKGLVPDSWPCAAGLFSGATTEAPLLEAADLIVTIGVDSVELIPNPWPYAASVVSAASWAETSPYFDLAVEVVGDLGKLVTELAQHWPATTWDADAGRRHRDAELERLVDGPRATRGLAPQAVVQRTRAAAPAGTIATIDAGAHMLPAMSLWTTQDVDEVLISSGLATMGYAVPAAIGAALARPGRRVVCFVGDGGLGMTIGELETVHRLGLPVTVVVFNDSRLSLIAIKAKPQGHGGEGAVGYTDTDFAAVAAGYGLAAQRVSTAAELDAALHASFARTGPTLLDVRVDPAGYPHVLNAVRGTRETGYE